MSKRRRYNERLQQPMDTRAATPQSTPTHQHHEARTHQRTPLLFALAAAVVCGLIAWAILSSMNRSNTAETTTATDDTLAVEQSNGTDQPAQNLGTTLQGASDQSRPGTGSDTLQSSGGSATIEAQSGAELFNQVEQGNLDLNVDQGIDTNASVDVE